MDWFSKTFWFSGILFLLLREADATTIICDGEECTVKGYVTNGEFLTDDNIIKAKAVAFVKSTFLSFPETNSTKLANICNITAIKCGIDGTEQLIKPDSIFVATNIQSLALGFNSIPKLEPPIFRNLTNLENLKLFKCKIEQISENAFEELINLKKLAMEQNFFTKIETKTFNTLEQLLWLDLSNNQLSSINLDIFKANVNLEILSLAANTLTTVNITKNNNSIKKISLDSNKIKDGGFIKFLQPIQQLEISHNPGILLSEDTFNSLRQLTQLWMAGVELQPNTNFKKLLMGLVNLQVLDIGDNNLRNLNVNNFPPLKSLLILGIYRNKFVTIENSNILKEKFPSLQSIDILDNDWDCSFSQSMTMNLIQNSIETVYLTPDFYHPRIIKTRFYLEIDVIKCRNHSGKPIHDETSTNNINASSNISLDVTVIG